MSQTKNPESHSGRKPNRLINEQSPYLRQHAYNPVDWHAWGPEALERAKAESKATEVTNNLEKLTEALGAITNYVPTGGDLKPGLATESARALASHYDSINGGLGQAPKFPNTFVFSLFLRVHAADGDEAMAEMVRHTLAKMARGGIYDQIGGGFHRYSVDDRWLVPHFEKMLYDNALLARLYLDAGRCLYRPEFLNVANEIFDYVSREMTSPEGGFYAAQDADSEGEEGKFFVWTPEEVERVVGPELSPLAERYFDITIEGNFEGANIPHRTIEIADAARMFIICEDE